MKILLHHTKEVSTGDIMHQTQHWNSYEIVNRNNVNLVLTISSCFMKNERSPLFSSLIFAAPKKKYIILKQKIHNNYLHHFKELLFAEISKFFNLT